MYHYITLNIVMRDCESIEDAIKRCETLLPQNPDENTQYMESWEIVQVGTPYDQLVENKP